MKNNLLFLKKRHTMNLLALTTLAGFLFLVSCNTTYEDVESPITISHEIPVDVDPEIQAKLKKNNDNFYALNQEFNKFSWQSFVAIFWPRDAKGNPLPKFTDEGTPTWMGWKEAFQVYREDGGVPAPWDSKRTSGALGLVESVFNDHEARVFLSTETPTGHKGSATIADETDQAFAGKLFDQNGNVVVYEVLMNKEEYDYVVDNKLYNRNGQIDFTNKHQIANFPAGDFKTHKVGAVEIKFAWKILEANDHKERYYSVKGYVVDPKTKALVKKDLGMIGFHISQKTPTGKQWVWSTFEHIDNLDQNTTEKDGKTTPIHPTLNDPDCLICPVNVDVESGGSTFQFNQGTHGDYWTVTGDTNKYFASSNVMKTQAKRMIDIPIRVQQINQQMQAYFKSQGSVWQFYQLIDTQYPTDQNVPPGNNTEAGYHLPESVTNKAGGNPNIPLLTNISMETFFQGGNQQATNLMEANPPSDITIFGTESCIGCHSSAGIFALGKTKITKKNPIARDSIVQLPQLSGDFSWLLSQKAQWDRKKPIPLQPPAPPKK